MRTYPGLLTNAVRSALRSKHDLMLENLALRQQLAVLTGQRARTQTKPADRRFWSWRVRRVMSPQQWKGAVRARGRAISDWDGDRGPAPQPPPERRARSRTRSNSRSPRPASRSDKESPHA